MTGSLASLLNRRFWLVAALYAVGAALFIGVPTRLIPNSFFTRMTPTDPRDYLIWGISSALMGALFALSSLYPVASVRETLHHIGSGDLRAITGSIFSLLSVGCPVCNKIVVLALGVTGALTIFDPLRPFLGGAVLLTLGLTLFLRLRALQQGCSLPSRATQTAP